MKKIIFPLVFLIFSSSFLSGAVNLSNSSGKSRYPTIAVNDNGDVMVAWAEWSNGDIYYRVYKNGSWSSMQNAGIAKYMAWSNQIAVDSAGEFHLSWADGHSSNQRDIYYSHYNGSQWKTEELLYRSTYNSAWNRIDIDSNDRIYIAWYHSYVSKTAPASADIVLMSKSKGGTWPSKYENISRKSGTQSIHPAFAVSGTNRYAAWMENKNPRRLYFCEYASGSWNTPVEIARPSYFPDMDVDTSGKLHMIYSNFSGNFYYISRAGGNWIKEILSNGNAPPQFGDIHCVNQVIAAAWTEEFRNAWAVYISSKNIGGQWSAPTRIAEGLGGSDGDKNVQVFVDKNNNAHLVWEAGATPDIYYQKVKLNSTPGTYIELDTYSMNFNTQANQSPLDQQFQLRSSDSNKVNYSITDDKSWLSVSPTSGDSSGEWDTITVSIDSSSMSNGQYTGNIKITSAEADNSPVYLTVNLTIGSTPSDTNIELNKSSLDFKTQANKSPNSKQFKLRAVGSKPIHYNISTDKGWLQVHPNHGDNSGEWDDITVDVNPGNLVVGQYTGNVIITSAEAKNSPVSLTVNLTIKLRNIPFPPTNVQQKYINHNGLMIKIFKNKITWKPNNKNKGRYNIKKYKIWEKISPGNYIHLAEVNANVFVYYDKEFKTKVERNQKSYAVSCVDSRGRQSEKVDASK